MNRAALVVLALALGGCAFAQKHPGVTIGVTAGVIGFSACAIAVEKLDTCALIGGIAGVGLGGLTGLVTMFADTNDHSIPPFEEEEDDAVIRSRTEPPPGLPDAGVGSTAPGATVDASVGQPDAAL